MAATIAELNGRHDQAATKLERELTVKEQQIAELNRRLEKKSAAATDELTSLRRELEATSALSAGKLTEAHRSEIIEARNEIERLRSSVSERDAAAVTAEKKAAEHASEVKMAQATLRGIALKLEPLRTASKTSGNDYMLTLATTMIGVAAELRVYLETHPGILSDVRSFEATEGALAELQAQATSEARQPTLHANSAELPLGQTFIDPVSGASLVISDTS